MSIQAFKMNVNFHVMLCLQHTYKSLYTLYKQYIYIYITIKKIRHKYERKECIDGRVLKEDRQDENDIIKL